MVTNFLGTSLKRIDLIKVYSSEVVKGFLLYIYMCNTLHNFRCFLYNLLYN